MVEKIPVKIMAFSEDGAGAAATFVVSKTSKLDLADCLWTCKTFMEKEEKKKVKKFIIEY